MPTPRYRVKTNNKSNSILIRFKQGNQFDTEVSTGIKVPKGKFSNSKQQINLTDEVDFKELNKKLRNLKTHIANKYSTDSVNGAIIDNKWLRNNVHAFLNKKTKSNKINSKHFFIPFLEDFIKEAEKRIDHPIRPIKKRTVEHYKTTKRKVEAFEEHKGKTLKIKDINLHFHDKFIEYLELEQNLNPNTVGGYIDVIRQVCRKAKLKGLDVNNEYESSDFYTPSNETLDTYLNLEEIHKIYNQKFELDYLDNARDWLIIGVWTGLRVSDLLSLTKSNIDGDFIKKDTLKTNFPVIIPKHNHVKQILNKRNGNFPRKISDQNFNKYIKKICKEVGLTEKIKGAKIVEIKMTKDGKKVKIHRKRVGNYPKYQLISSHICRRSFATNHYGKLDTLTIMKVTGHKLESQFLSYIKITPKEYAEKLKTYWEKIDVNEFVNS
ncbi:site-specific integrase [Seonamhaeicola sediminis]|uniref:Site-specific integrase n=1 Tax=Seonamhaeicola sediminis TaxID=2528206 RepID=A0A562YJ27_9FLAO|nr:phage integrase SAM-like domain-containing protein [Seonamhaeicola sediminis]TWO34707.1 site-specific integrase [Seonamhaeicola sediminis]